MNERGVSWNLPFCLILTTLSMMRFHHCWSSLSHAQFTCSKKMFLSDVILDNFYWKPIWRCKASRCMAFFVYEAFAESLWLLVTYGEEIASSSTIALLCLCCDESLSLFMSLSIFEWMVSCSISTDLLAWGYWTYQELEKHHTSLFLTPSFGLNGEAEIKEFLKVLYLALLESMIFCSTLNLFV